MKRLMLIGAALCMMFGTGACSMMGASVWTGEETQELRIDAAGMKHLYVDTHNGFIKHRGRAGGEAAVLVTVKLKGGGHTPADAQAALDAVELYSEEAPGGIRKLGWRWKKPKARHWNANVHFDVSAPADIALTANTYNGKVQVSDVHADTSIETHNGVIEAKRIEASLKALSYNGRLDIECRGDEVSLVTHNGVINADCTAKELRAESYNGRLDVVFKGGKVVLETHNGAISADLSACEQIGGSIETYNGNVLMQVGDKTAADVTVDTHSGHIDCDVPGELAKNVETLQKHKRHGSRCVSGDLGAGGAPLSVSTHNGNVAIKNPTKS